MISSDRFEVTTAASFSFAVSSLQFSFCRDFFCFGSTEIPNARARVASKQLDLERTADLFVLPIYGRKQKLERH